MKLVYFNLIFFVILIIDLANCKSIESSSLEDKGELFL